MIDHVSFGVRDIAAARRFYDAALAPLGYACLSAAEDSLGYGAGEAALWLTHSDHPVPADRRSGLHLCFGAPDPAAVDRFHAAAVRAGGEDNGAPGLRPDYGAGYYAAFVVDPDGYRIEAYCQAAS
ncbi:MAG TPA: VOC family protein [Acetobacteraceae bacterium]|nr:VOC family protein [Acetobacteraceae bacterium]